MKDVILHVTLDEGDMQMAAQAEKENDGEEYEKQASVSLY